MAYIPKKFITLLVTTLYLIFAICFHPQKAIALPAPISKEELLKNSDIYAKIKVLGVMRVDDQTYSSNPTQTQNNYAEVYQAWVQLLEIYKGEYKIRDTIIVRWQVDKHGLIGSWFVPLANGEEVTIYLKKYVSQNENNPSNNKSSDYYTATYYTAKEN